MIHSEWTEVLESAYPRLALPHQSGWDQPVYTVPSTKMPIDPLPITFCFVSGFILVFHSLPVGGGSLMTCNTYYSNAEKV